jgi:hypothetical protein
VPRGGAEGRPEEEGRREDAANERRREREGDARELGGERDRRLWTGSPAPEPLGDRGVADAEGFRRHDAEEARDAPGDRAPRDECAAPRPLHELREASQEDRDDARKPAGRRAAEKPQDREAEELAQVAPAGGRGGEEPFAAEERPLDDGRRDGGQERAPEDAARGRPQDLLEREDDPGDRRAEDGGDPRRGADRHHPADHAPRQPEGACGRHGEPARQDDGRPLGAEGSPGAERESVRAEGADERPPVEEVRGLSRVGPPHEGEPAPGAGREARDEPGQEGPGRGGEGDEERAAREPARPVHRRADEEGPDELDRAVERDRHEAAPRSDQDDRDEHGLARARPQEAEESLDAVPGVPPAVRRVLVQPAPPRTAAARGPRRRWSRVCR